MQQRERLQQLQQKLQQGYLKTFETFNSDDYITGNGGDAGDGGFYQASSLTSPPQSLVTTGAISTNGQNLRHSQYLSTAVMGGRCSEDSSDYTSDLNYPVAGQNVQAAATGQYQQQQYNVMGQQPYYQQQPMIDSYDYQGGDGYYDDSGYGQVPDNSYTDGDYDQDELFYNSRPPK